MGYYGEVEGVSSDDLMGVGGWAHAWADKRVGPFDSELRAGKSKHVLRRGRLRQKRASSNSVPKHDGRLCVQCWSGRRCFSVISGLFVLKVGLDSNLNINHCLQA
jgi:hypothetical protein